MNDTLKLNHIKNQINKYKKQEKRHIAFCILGIMNVFNPAIYDYLGLPFIITLSAFLIIIVIFQRFKINLLQSINLSDTETDGADNNDIKEKLIIYRDRSLKQRNLFLKIMVPTIFIAMLSGLFFGIKPIFVAIAVITFIFAFSIGFMINKIGRAHV